MNLKKFSMKEHHPLTSLKGIQEWYNALTSLGEACNIFIPPWDDIVRHHIMGNRWVLQQVPVDTFNRYNEMSAVLHHFLSHHEAFGGSVAHFSKIMVTSQDGYQCLHQIVRHVHPALGQAPKQQRQPQQRRDQDFISYSVDMLNYFQSESCENRYYPENSQALICIENLHPTWRQQLRKRYVNIVNQDVPIPIVPSECMLTVLGTTLTQWCHQEGLPQPNQSPSNDRRNVFALAGPVRAELMRRGDDHLFAVLVAEHADIHRAAELFDPIGKFLHAAVIDVRVDLDHGFSPTASRS